MIIEDNFKWEQKFIDNYKPFKKRGYNLNKKVSCPPSILSKETILKRTITNKETQRIASQYYYQIKNNENVLENVPKKYYNIVKYRLNTTVWNKGLIMSNEHKKKLSIAASNRNFTEEGTLKRKEAFFKLRHKIAVYKNDNLLKIYNEFKELINDEWLKEHISEFKARKGKELKYPNIISL